MRNEAGRERQKEMAKSAATGSHEMPSATVLARRRGKLRTTMKNNGENPPIFGDFNKFDLFGGDGLTEADM